MWSNESRYRTQVLIVCAFTLLSSIFLFLWIHLKTIKFSDEFGMTFREYGILLTPPSLRGPRPSASASGASSSQSSTAQALPPSERCRPISSGRLPRLTLIWWWGRCLAWGKGKSNTLVQGQTLWEVELWPIVSLSSHRQKADEILKKCCPKWIFMSLTWCKLKIHWSTLSNSNRAGFVKKICMDFSPTRKIFPTSDFD